MSDISTGGDAPSAASVPPPASAPPPATDSGADDTNKFGEHAAYIKELRAEAAKHRTENTPWKEAFGEYDDTAKGEWLRLAKLLKADPSSGAEEFIRIGQSLKDQLTPKQQAVQEAAEASEAADKPMTRAEMQKFVEDRETKVKEERAIEDITAKVSVKYPAGTFEHRETLYLAANETGGDIEKALALVAKREQGVIDKYHAAKKAQGGVTPVSAQGQQAGEAQSIKTFGDAKAALKARLAATQA